MTFILASASPRREELLRQVGCKFYIVTSDIVEDNGQKLPPAELAVAHARAKALEVAARSAAGDIVIGADTVVVYGGQVYGKPADAGDARRMLSELAGDEHQVVTGIAVSRGGQVWTDFAVTAVRLRPLSQADIDGYIATGEPFGKAGAYAIQGIGALLVEGICGCYSNVVGLPLRLLDDLLRRSVGVGLRD